MRRLLFSRRKLNHSRLRLLRLLGLTSLLPLRSSAVLPATTSFLIPHFLDILATDPRFQLLLVGVILGRFHSFNSWVVTSEPHEIDFLIVGGAKSSGLFSCKTRVANTLNTSPMLTMNTSTRHAYKRSNSEIHARRKLGVTVTATLVGRQLLELSNDIIRRFLFRRATTSSGAAARSRSRRCKHTLELP